MYHDPLDAPTISVDGIRRLTQLMRWIDADHKPGLPIASEQWRDEVIPRLPPGRPLIVQAPKLLATRLKLAMRFVYIGHQNEMYEIVSFTSRRHFKLGRLIVPPQQLVTDAERECFIAYRE